MVPISPTPAFRPPAQSSRFPDRRHDLRLLREPHRAVPSARPTASLRGERETSRRNGRPSSSIRPRRRAGAKLVGAVRTGRLRGPTGARKPRLPPRPTSQPPRTTHGRPAEQARALPAREPFASIAVAIVLDGRHVSGRRTVVPMEQLNWFRAWFLATFVQFGPGRRFYTAAWRGRPPPHHQHGPRWSPWENERRLGVQPRRHAGAADSSTRPACHPETYFGLRGPRSSASSCWAAGLEATRKGSGGGRNSPVAGSASPRRAPR